MKIFTLDNGQEIRIGELTDSMNAVPVSDLSDDERAELPKLRSIAKSPARSHAHVVPGLTPDPAEALRSLGRYTREHPTPFKNANRPMVDAR